jgi:hypothetical protein
MCLGSNGWCASGKFCLVCIAAPLIEKATNGRLMSCTQKNTNGSWPGRQTAALRRTTTVSGLHSATRTFVLAARRCRIPPDWPLPSNIGEGLKISLVSHHRELTSHQVSVSIRTSAYEHGATSVRRCIWRHTDGFQQMLVKDERSHWRVVIGNSQCSRSG